MRTFYRQDWVVYAKPCFGGPEHLLHYLAPLYASRRHLQPSPALGLSCGGPLSLEGQQELDAIVTDEGHAFHVDTSALEACIKKQDTTKQNASVRSGLELGVSKTPTSFINGAKIDGAVPITFVFEMVDNALKAEGRVPPRHFRRSW